MHSKIQSEFDYKEDMIVNCFLILFQVPEAENEESVKEDEEE